MPICTLVKTNAEVNPCLQQRRTKKYRKKKVVLARIWVSPIELCISSTQAEID